MGEKSKKVGSKTLYGVSLRAVPLNWIVEKVMLKEISGESEKYDLKFEIVGYFDGLDQADSCIRNNFSDYYDPLLKDEVIRDLGLSKTDSTSAYDLTNVRKHPLFQKKVSRKSLKNLKRGDSIGQISMKKQMRGGISSKKGNAIKCR
jgi:hypothetical protein